MKLVATQKRSLYDGSGRCSGHGHLTICYALPAIWLVSKSANQAVPDLRLATALSMPFVGCFAMGWVVNNLQNILWIAYVCFVIFTNDTLVSAC